MADNIIPTTHLAPGDKFRYIGSDSSQVCSVHSINEETGKLEYDSGNTHANEYIDLKYPVNVIS